MVDAEELTGFTRAQKKAIEGLRKCDYVVSTGYGRWQDSKGLGVTISSRVISVLVQWGYVVKLRGTRATLTPKGRALP